MSRLCRDFSFKVLNQLITNSWLSQLLVTVSKKGDQHVSYQKEMVTRRWHYSKLSDSNITFLYMSLVSYPKTKPHISSKIYQHNTRPNAIQCITLKNLILTVESKLIQIINSKIKCQELVSFVHTIKKQGTINLSHFIHSKD